MVVYLGKLSQFVILSYVDISVIQKISKLLSLVWVGFSVSFLARHVRYLNPSVKLLPGRSSGKISLVTPLLKMTDTGSIKMIALIYLYRGICICTTSWYFGLVESWFKKHNQIFDINHIAGDIFPVVFPWSICYWHYYIMFICKTFKNMNKCSANIGHSFNI